MNKNELQDRNNESPAMRKTVCPPAASAVVEEPQWLLNIEQLAFLLNRSVPSLERDAAAGRLPAAVRIGGSRRWRRRDILEWVEAGCPLRSDRQGRVAGE
jgi:predicted DNA-binding transcriptional regulator AlpA